MARNNDSIHLSNTKSLAALSTIRQQLWAGHASVMVGSGFSRNADRASPGTRVPPDWNELAMRFIDELYPYLDEKEKSNILKEKNALQLAQEFEASRQRSGLTHYIKETIDDGNLRPNLLFHRLLELPWNDVFTTNYDTLLERAAQSVLTRKYDIVYSCKDLAYSEQPRIIKLHGSLHTDATPLIITEEDYRTYPTQYSPFVNTVQQALMENQLCLIGFSGSDPNFLKWIGWVRDNLGESMPSIYLLSFSNLSDPARRVLESKHIISVDLSEIAMTGNHEYVTAFESTFSYLEERPSSVDWNPIDLGTFHKGKPHAIIDYIEKMVCNRKDYPNWLIMPSQKQERLFSDTERHITDISYLETLPSQWDIYGLYELNWRMERCFMPIHDTIIVTYKKILKKYKLHVISPHCDPNFKQMWIEICFAAYRWSRENNDRNLHNELEQDIIIACKGCVESTNHLRYEQALWALSLPDFELFDSTLKQWEREYRPPLWNVRYAAFLCETGYIIEALRIYEQVLSEIKPCIPKSQINVDFYLLSLEGSVLASLLMANAAQNFILDNNEDTYHESLHRQRLQYLSTIDCAPYTHMSRFCLLLRAPEQRETGTFKKREFDHEVISIKHRSGWPKEIKNAVQFARYIEEAGIPLFAECIVNDLSYGAPGCIKRLANSLPSWALGLYLQAGKSDDTTEEIFLSQTKVYALPNDQVDALIQRYIRQTEYLINRHSERFENRLVTIYHRGISTLLEFLSRLAAKASQESLTSLLSLGCSIQQVFIRFFRHSLGSLYTFYRRIISAMTPENAFSNLELLLKIGLLKTDGHLWSNKCPICFVHWNEYHRNPSDCPSSIPPLLAKYIEMLLSDNQSERSYSLSALVSCINLGICTENQRQSIAQNLCKYLDTDVIPNFSDFYIYSLLLEPIIVRDEILARIKHQYLNFDFSSSTNSSINRTDSVLLLSHSMLTTSSVVHSLQRYRIDLTDADAMTILTNYKTGLKNSLPLLQPSNTSSLNSMRIWSRYSPADYLLAYDRVLGEILIPRINPTNQSDISDWLDTLNCPFPFLCTNVAMLTNFADRHQSVEFQIVSALSSNCSVSFSDAIQALLNWYKLASNDTMPCPSQIIIQTLVFVISTRDGSFFRDACTTLGLISRYTVFPNELQQLLLNQIDFLAEATKYDSPISRFTIESRCDHRVNTALLANRLYHAYRRRDATIPSEILKWKDICSSKDELYSVRNCWIENDENGLNDDIS